MRRPILVLFQLRESNLNGMPCGNGLNRGQQEGCHKLADRLALGAGLAGSRLQELIHLRLPARVAGALFQWFQQRCWSA